MSLLRKYSGTTLWQLCVVGAYFFVSVDFLSVVSTDENSWISTPFSSGTSDSMLGDIPRPHQLDDYTSARVLINCRCSNCDSLSVSIRVGDWWSQWIASHFLASSLGRNVVNHYKWPSKSFHYICYQLEPLWYTILCYSVLALLSWYLFLPLWPSVLRGGRWQMRLWENGQIFHPYPPIIFYPRHQRHAKTTQNAQVCLAKESEYLGMHLLGFFDV